MLLKTKFSKWGPGHRRALARGLVLRCCLLEALVNFEQRAPCFVVWPVLSVMYILNQFYVIVGIFSSVSGRPVYPAQVCKSTFVLLSFSLYA